MNEQQFRDQVTPLTTVSFPEDSNYELREAEGRLWVLHEGVVVESDQREMDQLIRESRMAWAGV